MKEITLGKIIQRADKATRRRLLIKELKLLGLVFAAWILLCAFDAFLYATTGYSLLFSSLQSDGVQAATFGILLFAAPPFFIAFRLLSLRWVLADRVTRFLFFSEHSINNEEYDLLHAYIRNQNKVVMLLIAIVALFIVIALNL